MISTTERETKTRKRISWFDIYLLRLTAAFRLNQDAVPVANNSTPPTVKATNSVDPCCKVIPTTSRVPIAVVEQS
jgi:hypothetical protein